MAKLVSAFMLGLRWRGFTALPPLAGMALGAALAPCLALNLLVALMGFCWLNQRGTGHASADSLRLASSSSANSITRS